jgi:hypothetical protein
MSGEIKAGARASLHWYRVVLVYQSTTKTQTRMERQYNHRKGRIGTRAQPSAGPHGQDIESGYQIDKGSKEDNGTTMTKAVGEELLASKCR